MSLTVGLLAESTAGAGGPISSWIGVAVAGVAGFFGLAGSRLVRSTRLGRFRDFASIAPTLPEERGLDEVDEMQIERRELSHIRNEEVRATFRAKRMYMYSSLTVGIVAAGVFLYGAYVAITGDITAGIFTDLASGVPGLLSGVLFNQAKQADSDAASKLALVDRDVQQFARIRHLERLALNSSDQQTRDELYTLSALHLLFPEASVSEIVTLKETLSLREPEVRKARRRALPKNPLSGGNGRIGPSGSAPIANQQRGTITPAPSMPANRDDTHPVDDEND